MQAERTLLNAICRELKKYPAVVKAVLFGSRARGDAKERSDYDIALYGNIDRSTQTALRYCFDDELPTLHKIDLIFMQDDLPEAFRESIEREGVKFYG